MKKLLYLLIFFSFQKLYADTKVSALTQDTTAQATDLIYKVDAGNISRSITIGNVLNSSMNVTFNGISASTLTVVNQISGAGLSNCGDATHAVSWNSSTSQFGCQSITGTTSTGNLSGSTVAVTMIFDGGGSAITAGSTSTITIPFACTISSWTVLAPRESGSITIGIKKASFANFPALTDMVGAGNAPALSSAQKNTAAPASWTSTSISAGDSVSFIPSGITSTTWANIVLWLIRT